MKKVGLEPSEYLDSILALILYHVLAECCLKL